MEWGAPEGFVLGLLGITAMGAMLPLDFGGRREEHVIFTIAATAGFSILGPPELAVVWGAVAVAVAMTTALHLLRAAGVVSRGPRWSSLRWVAATAIAVSVGFAVANLVYVGIFQRGYPVRIESLSDTGVAALTLTAAWFGTGSVRLATHRLVRLPVTGSGLDPFDSVLVPYLLPVVGGAPIVVASVAAYSPQQPWSALAVLLWCLPLYGACAFDLHRRRLAQDLRRDIAAKQRLAAMGEVTARIIHQSRHQVGLMGWSIHRLRRSIAALPADRRVAAEAELDALAEAKERLQRMLTSQLLHEPAVWVDPSEGDDEPGGRDAAVTEAPLGQEIDAVLAQLRDDASAAGVELSSSVPAAVAASATPARLREAIFNLVDNAVDAAASTVVVQVVPTETAWEVWVCDDGAGLPADVSQVFEPFFSTKPEGSGMGLAITEALVDELGGTLRHERVDAATRFVVALPPEFWSGAQGSGSSEVSPASAT